MVTAEAGIGAERSGPVGLGGGRKRSGTVGIASTDLSGTVFRREQTLESIFASEDRKPGRNGLGQARVNLLFVVFAL